MLTAMTERDWSIVLDVFDAAQSNRGEPGHDDRRFVEAIHYFTVHSITWRALPCRGISCFQNRGYRSIAGCADCPRNFAKAMASTMEVRSATGHIPAFQPVALA
jgi:hypothetical protein